MAIQVRKAVPEDFPEIHRLIQTFATFQGTPDKVNTSVDQMIEDQNVFSAFVAEEDDQILGFATWFFAYYSWTGRAIYLDDLFVQEAHRGRGIGQLLMNKVIETAQLEGCKKMRWQVSSWNEKAITFYRKIGATIDNVEINCDLHL